MIKKTILLVFIIISISINVMRGQELQARVTINYSQIQGTDASVFEDLEKTLTQFINDRQWTNLQFQKNERIPCNFNITVTKYDNSSNLFTCKATIQANRPIYNSTYTSTIYNNTDNDFNFNYAQFDQLQFNEENVDNQLTALIAYYAYLIIGINLDTFAPMGGEEVLQQCMNLANNSQNLNFPGWKAFDNDRNRFAIINDYLDGGMKTFRQLQYDYYRTGLDEMANNVERGRTNITTAIENGEIGAFCIDNSEAVCKTFRKLPSGLILLESANPNYEPIEVDVNDECFRVVGKYKFKFSVEQE